MKATTHAWEWLTHFFVRAGVVGAGREDGEDDEKDDNDTGPSQHRGRSAARTPKQQPNCRRE